MHVRSRIMILRFTRRNAIWTALVALLLVNVIISLRILRATGEEGSKHSRLRTASSSEVGGELRIRGADGRVLGTCPLQHTDVDADIAGHITRVHVRQTFTNPLSSKIEAVYVFPLPQDSAVDSMVMTVGDRRIVGQVKPKPEARKTYETAKASGHVASLLDQERPNIFKQSVANIEPGAQVEIDISYVETLAFADGIFEFVFPMVVGPRYMPGNTTGNPGINAKADASGLSDNPNINPPVAPPPTRAGHDITMTV